MGGGFTVSGVVPLSGNAVLFTVALQRFLKYPESLLEWRMLSQMLHPKAGIRFKQFTFLICNS